MTEKRTLDEITSKRMIVTASTIFNAMALSEGATQQAAAEIDPRVTLDALMFVAAAIVEPALSDGRLKEMKGHAEDLGSLFLSFLRQARSEYEKTGVHLFEGFAGQLVPREANDL